jgi:hypothetical protein
MTPAAVTKSMSAGILTSCAAGTIAYSAYEPRAIA